MDFYALDMTESSVTYASEFKRLLNVFSNEVLKDFKDYISDICKVPAAIWTVGIDGNLYKLDSNSPLKHYPGFCRDLLRNENADGWHYCIETDKNKNIFKTFTDNSRDIKSKWEIVSCPLGLKRIVFPIQIDGQLAGILVSGKFVISNEDRILIHDKLTDLLEGTRFETKCPIGKDAEKLLVKLEYGIDDIEVYLAKDIDRIVNKVTSLMPLLQRYCKHVHPNNQIYDGMIFLESIEQESEEVFLSNEALWRKARRILKKIATHFDLKYASIYFSERDDLMRLLLSASYPASDTPYKELSLSSYEEMHKLLCEGHCAIPTSEESWFNSHSDRIILSENGALYARKILTGKALIIALGYKGDLQLNDYGSLILGMAIDKVFKFLNKSLTSVEFDYIMAETGHMLDRSAGSVKSGYDTLKLIGFNSRDTDDDETRKLRTLAINSMDIGLLKLDLVIRNHHSFKRSKDKISGRGDGVKAERVDVLEILNKYHKAYRIELTKEEEQKEIQYDLRTADFYVPGPADVIDLIVFNLIDNAVKFAYNGTYIKVSLSEVDNCLELKVYNLGVGVARDEYNLVFDMYYQSRYKDPNKRREGTGLGLATCKRNLKLFYGKRGKISIKSEKAHTRHKRRFDGDNFITTLTVTIPREVAV